jgi:4-hydroxybenzoate polyprenyltransferase
MLLAASALLYTAGMVLNDVCDLRQDQQQRPSRPLPSGRIDWHQARRVGYGLLLCGVILGWLAGWMPGSAAALPWRGGVIATLLALLVVLYDGVLKRTPGGPWAMGGCRLLNVLLGMSLSTRVVADPVVLGYDVAQLYAAGGIGLYITGVTWFARSEASVSRRGQLAAATFAMACGIAVLGLIYRALPPDAPRTLADEATWFLLLGLLAFTILRRCSAAVSDPQPPRVQLAVKNAIWSLIMLDAAVALLVAPPAWSLVIVALLIPTMLLGRHFSAT